VRGKAVVIEKTGRLASLKLHLRPQHPAECVEGVSPHTGWAGNFRKTHIRGEIGEM